MFKFFAPLTIWQLTSRQFTRVKQNIVSLMFACNNLIVLMLLYTCFSSPSIYWPLLTHDDGTIDKEFDLRSGILL